jgi:hypothetical protein
MRPLRTVAFLVLGVTGCASSAALTEQSNQHMAAASHALSEGNYTLARTEQRKGEQLYQRAVSQAYEEGRQPPPPPATPLPVFDPQLEKHHD